MDSFNELFNRVKAANQGVQVNSNTQSPYNLNSGQLLINPNAVRANNAEQEQEIDRTGQRQLGFLDSIFAADSRLADSIIDASGFNAKWSDVHKAWDEGRSGIPEVISAAPNFLASVPLGMVGGLVGAPSKVYEAATGTPVTEADDDNWIPDYELSGEQRLATLADAGIDVGLLALGGSATAIRGAKAAATGGKFMRKGGLLSDSAEEAGEEFVQQYLGTIRGDQDNNGISAINSGTFGEALEAAALGGLGGAVMHGAGVGIGKLANYEANKRANYEADKRNAVDNKVGTESNYDDITPYTNPEVHSYSVEDVPYISGAIAEDAFDRQMDRNKIIDGGHSSTATSKPVQRIEYENGVPKYTIRHVGINEAYDNLSQVVEALASNALKKTTLEDGETNDDATTSTRRDEMAEAWNMTEEDLAVFDKAYAENDIETIVNLLNRKIDTTPVYATIGKAPGYNFGPYKVRIRGLHIGNDMVSVNPMFTNSLGADYDADRVSVVYSKRLVGNARYITDNLDNKATTSLRQPDQASVIPDMKKYGFNINFLLSLKNRFRQERIFGLVDGLINNSSLVNHPNVDEIKRSIREFLKDLAVISKRFERKEKDFTEEDEHKIYAEFDKAVSKLNNNIRNDLGEDENSYDNKADIISHVFSLLLDLQERTAIIADAIDSINDNFNQQASSVRTYTEPGKVTGAAYGAVTIENMGTIRGTSTQLGIAAAFNTVMTTLNRTAKENEAFRTYDRFVYGQKGDANVQIALQTIARADFRDVLAVSLQIALAQDTEGHTANQLTEMAFKAKVAEKLRLENERMDSSISYEEFKDLFKFDDNGKLSADSRIASVVEEVSNDWNAAQTEFSNGKEISIRGVILKNPAEAFLGDKSLDILLAIIGDRKIESVINNLDQDNKLAMFTFNELFELMDVSAVTDIHGAFDNNQPMMSKIIFALKERYDSRLVELEKRLMEMIESEDITGIMSDIRKLETRNGGVTASQAATVINDNVAILNWIATIIGESRAAKIGLFDVRDVFDVSRAEATINGTASSRSRDTFAAKFGRAFRGIDVHSNKLNVKNSRVNAIFSANIYATFKGMFDALSAVRQDSASLYTKRMAANKILTIASMTKLSHMDSTLHVVLCENILGVFDSIVKTTDINSATEEQLDMAINESMRMIASLSDPEIIYDHKMNLLDEISMQLSKNVSSKKPWFLESFLSDSAKSIDALNLNNRKLKANKYLSRARAAQEAIIENHVEDLSNMFARNQAITDDMIEKWFRDLQFDYDIDSAGDALADYTYNVGFIKRANAEKAQADPAAQAFYLFSTGADEQIIETFMSSYTTGLFENQFDSFNDFLNSRDAILRILSNKDEFVLVPVNGVLTKISRDILFREYGINYRPGNLKDSIVELFRKSPRIAQAAYRTKLNVGEKFDGSVAAENSTTGNLLGSFRLTVGSEFNNNTPETRWERVRQIIARDLATQSRTIYAVIHLCNPEILATNDYKSVKQEIKRAFELLVDTQTLAAMGNGDDTYSLAKRLSDKIPAFTMRTINYLSSNFDFLDGTTTEQMVADLSEDSKDIAVKALADLFEISNDLTKAQPGNISIPEVHLDASGKYIDTDEIFAKTADAAMASTFLQVLCESSFGGIMAGEDFDAWISPIALESGMSKDELSKKLRKELEDRGHVFTTDKDFENGVKHLIDGNYEKYASLVTSTITETRKEAREISRYLDAALNAPDRTETSIRDAFIKAARFIAYGNSSIVHSDFDKSVKDTIAKYYDEKSADNKLLKETIAIKAISERLRISNIGRGVRGDSYDRQFLENMHDMMQFSRELVDNMRDMQKAGYGIGESDFIAKKAADLERRWAVREFNVADKHTNMIATFAMDRFSNMDVPIRTGINGQEIKTVAILGFLSSRGLNPNTGKSCAHVPTVSVDEFIAAHQEPSDKNSEQYYYWKLFNDEIACGGRYLYIDEEGKKHNITKSMIANNGAKLREKNPRNIIDVLDCDVLVGCSEHPVDCGYTIFRMLADSMEGQLIKIKKTMNIVDEAYKKAKVGTIGIKDIQGSTLVSPNLDDSLTQAMESLRTQREYYWRTLDPMFGETGMSEVSDLNRFQRHWFAMFCSNFVEVHIAGTTRIMSVTKFKEEFKNFITDPSFTFKTYVMSPRTISAKLVHVANGVLADEDRRVAFENAERASDDEFSSMVSNELWNALSDLDDVCEDPNNTGRIARELSLANLVPQSVSMFDIHQNTIAPAISRFLEMDSRVLVADAINRRIRTNGESRFNVIDSETSGEVIIGNSLNAERNFPGIPDSVINSTRLKYNTFKSNTTIEKNSIPVGSTITFGLDATVEHLSEILSASQGFDLLLRINKNSDIYRAAKAQFPYFESNTREAENGWVFVSSKFFVDNAKSSVFMRSYQPDVTIPIFSTNGGTVKANSLVLCDMQFKYRFGDSEAIATMYGANNIVVDTGEQLYYRKIDAPSNTRHFSVFNDIFLGLSSEAKLDIASKIDIDMYRRVNPDATKVNPETLRAMVMSFNPNDIENVSPNRIVAIVQYDEYDPITKEVVTKYVPIVSTGTMPQKFNITRGSFDVRNGGIVFNYSAHFNMHDPNFDQLMKLYFPNYASKFTFTTREGFDAKANGDVQISFAIDGQSMDKRLVGDMSIADKARTLFAIFYENIGYNIVDGEESPKSLFAKAIIEANDKYPDRYTFSRMLSRITNGNIDAHTALIVKHIVNNARAIGFPVEALFRSRQNEFTTAYTDKLFEGLRIDEIYEYYNFINEKFCPRNTSYKFKSIDEDPNAGSEYIVDGDLRTRFKITEGEKSYYIIEKIYADRAVINGPITGISAISTRTKYGATDNMVSLLRHGPKRANTREAIRDMYAFNVSAYRAVQERLDRDNREDMSVYDESSPTFKYIDQIEAIRSIKKQAKDFKVFPIHERGRKAYLQSLRSEFYFAMKNSLKVFEFVDGEKVYIKNTDPRITEILNGVRNSSGKHNMPWFYLQRMVAARRGISSNGDGLYDISFEELNAEAKAIAIAYNNKQNPLVINNGSSASFIDGNGKRRVNIPVLEEQTMRYIFEGTVLESNPDFKTFEDFKNDCFKRLEVSKETITTMFDVFNKKEAAQRNALLRYIDFLLIDNGKQDEVNLGWIGSSMRERLSDANEMYLKVREKAFGVRNAYDTQIQIQELTNKRQAAINEAYESMSKKCKGTEVITNDAARGNAIAVSTKKDSEYFGKTLDMMTGISRFMVFVGNVPLAIANYVTKAIDYANGLFLVRWADGGKLSPYATENRIKISDETIKAVSHSKEVQRLMDALRTAYFLGETTEFMALVQQGKLDVAMDKYENMEGIFKGKFGKLYSMTMKFGSAANLCRTQRTEIWLRRFCEMAGERGIVGLDQLSADGTTLQLETDLANRPLETIVDLFTLGNTASTAYGAFNGALKGDMAQQTWLSILFDSAAQNHKGFNFLMTTCCTKFFMASVNWTSRVMNMIAPVSTFNYVMNEVLIKYGDKLAENEFGKKFFDKSISLKAMDAQMYSSLQEAIRVDLMHMTIPALACVIAACAFFEPPEDDDKWLNVDEWTICGIRLGGEWWLTDALGFGIPLACWWKSVLLGKPNGNLLTKSLSETIYTNPFMRAGDVIGAVLDPEKMLDAYNADAQRYADYKQGSPDGMEYIMGSAGALGLSYISQFFTPSILKEITRSMPQYETSSNRIFKETLTGTSTQSANEIGATEYTTFFDAQIRKVTKSNPILGVLMNALPTGSNTSYLGWEMPRTYMVDQTQMDFARQNSVLNEDGTMKSDEEVNALCCNIVYTLNMVDDMDALYKSGWYLDSATKKAVSSYLYDMRQYFYDKRSEYAKATNGFDYYVLGNGDYSAGKLAYTEYQDAFHDAINIINGIYYDKLWSSELNQGLQYYNRWNTTYNEDANGNVYATGQRQGLGGILNPLTYAPDESGASNDWASKSAVTGLTMFDENGNAIRGLVPWKTEREDVPDFDSWGEKNGNKSASDTSGYRVSSYGGTTYSRGGSSGGGGGSYGRTINIPRPKLNAQRPDDMNVVRTNDARFDYLRPSFETKGSRDAYRREDI